MYSHHSNEPEFIKEGEGGAKSSIADTKVIYSLIQSKSEHLFISKSYKKDVNSKTDQFISHSPHKFMAPKLNPIPTTKKALLDQNIYDAWMR